MPIQTAPTTNSEVAISPTLSPDTAVATDTSLTTSANLRDTAQQHLDTENRADIQNPPNTTTSDFVSRSEYDRLRTDNFRSIIRDLKYAMDGYTSSYWEKDIVRSMQRLENYTPEEKAEFIKMYEADGRSLQADLKSELSPQDYAKCMGYLRTDNDITTKLTEYAADLNYAMKGGWGIGTDEKTIARIMNEVEKLSPAEKGQLKSIYNKEFGSHLEEHLKGELSGNDLHSALGKLNGPTYAAERINSTKSISEIHKLLKDASPEELAEIKQAFQERYGQSLAEYIEQCPLRRAGSRGVASSIRQQALKDQLLVTLDGSPEAKEALVLAAYLKSPRDNAEKIEKLLENKTPEQIAALEAKYKEMYGSRADYRNDERILKLFTRNLSSQPAETVVSKEPEAEIKTSAAGVSAPGGSPQGPELRPANGAALSPSPDIEEGPQLISARGVSLQQTEPQVTSQAEIDLRLKFSAVKDEGLRNTLQEYEKARAGEDLYAINRLKKILSDMDPQVLEGWIETASKWNPKTDQQREFHADFLALFKDPHGFNAESYTVDAKGMSEERYQEEMEQYRLRREQAGDRMA